MATKDEDKNAYNETISKLRLASRTIHQSMEVLPYEQLLTAIGRGFRPWPYRPPGTVAEFLVPALQTITDQARVLTRAEFTALGVGRSPSDVFHPWVASGLPAETSRTLSQILRPAGLLGILSNRREAIRSRDIRTHPSYREFPPPHPPITSFVGVPVLYRDAPIGALYACNKKGDEEFTLEEEVALAQLAEMAASALQQAYFQASYEVQQAQIQTILDSAPSGIVYVDARTGNITSNYMAMEIFGRTLYEESGSKQYINYVCRPDGQPITEAELPSTLALQGKVSLEVELAIRRPDGSLVPILVNAAPVRGLRNRVLGAVAIFRDISTAKELERLRNDYFMMLAHDLRNPAQAILTGAELLQKNHDKEWVRAPISAIRQIRNNILRIHEMIRELTDVAQIESRQLLLQPKPTKLRELTAQVLDRLRPAYQDHEITLESPSHNLPTVNVDWARFDQILTNLIDNAAKYSKSGTPIRIFLQSVDHGVRISIRDQGFGIPTEDQPHIFDRYFRSRRTARGRTGLGLGLYIVKSLVDAHHGGISIESAPNQGSTFHVWFPESGTGLGEKSDAQAA